MSSFGIDTELHIARFVCMDDGLCHGIPEVMLAHEGLAIDLVGVFTKFSFSRLTDRDMLANGIVHDSVHTS